MEAWIKNTFASFGVSVVISWGPVVSEPKKLKLHLIVETKYSSLIIFMFRTSSLNFIFIFFFFFLTMRSHFFLKKNWLGSVVGYIYICILLISVIKSLVFYYNNASIPWHNIRIAVPLSSMVKVNSPTFFHDIWNAFIWDEIMRKLVHFNDLPPNLDIYLLWNVKSDFPA